MVAGVAYAWQAVVSAVSPGGALQEIVWFVAVLLTAVGLVGFHALQIGELRARRTRGLLHSHRGRVGTGRSRLGVALVEGWVS